MESVYRWVTGIDVHKSMLAVVVRREQGGNIEYEKRKFGTTRSEIEHLAAWLQHHQVQDVVMESTAQYWRPVWYGLEPHFRLHLCHPLKVQARRGRKWDYRDAQRLADRWNSGDLEESFIPGPDQRAWRWLTRRRVQLTRLITLVRNHVECLLEQGGIKLSAVVTDLFGVSGWAMLQLLAKGETDTAKIAETALGKLRKKDAELKEALAGKLEPTYRMILRQSLNQVELLRRQVEEINKELAVVMREHAATLVRLTKIPGVQLAAAHELLAEIGPRASAFPTPEQFASWVGLCPGSKQSAGVCYSTRSAKGNCYLRRLLCQTAWAATHAKGTFFAGLFARMLPRLGSKAAAWTVAHRIGKVVWLLLHEGLEYKEMGPAPLKPASLARKFRRLVQELAHAGLDPKSLLDQYVPVTS
jgi:transposase